MTHVSATPVPPSISACLIVKDEAANLRPCLESLGDLASELIVVDTGSTDDTVQIAGSLGASVHSFAWVDDFAAARNESLRHATGEWVFWLDADDRLSAKAVAQLKQAAASGKADAFICEVVSRHPDGSHDVTEHVRLFRNGLGISFTGALHESVFPRLVEMGLVAARTDISIEHAGYQSAEVVRAKSRRNLPILDREMALHPERLDLLFYRGHTLAILDEPERATAELRSYLAGTRPQNAYDQLRFWAYADLARCMEKLGGEQGLEELLRSALSEFREHPYFLTALGRVLLGKGKSADAIRQLRAAREALNGRVRGFWPPRVDRSGAGGGSPRHGADRRGDPVGRQSQGSGRGPRSGDGAAGKSPPTARPDAAGGSAERIGPHGEG